MQSEWLIIASSAGKAALEPLDSPGSIRLCLQQSWAQLSINSAQLNLLSLFYTPMLGLLRWRKKKKKPTKSTPLGGLGSFLIRRRGVQWPDLQRGLQHEGEK